MNYQQLKAEHAKELNEFEGIFFAFSNSQFAEGMEKVGLNEGSVKDILSLGSGGYIKRDRKIAFNAMFLRHTEGMEALKKEEKLLVDALCYELRNHEYCITGDPSDALSALDLTVESVDKKVLKKALKEHNKCVFNF